MKKIIISFTLIFGIFTIGLCGDPPPFNPGNPSSIPIDGGAFALLGAGVGFGIKKIKDRKNAI